MGTASPLRTVLSMEADDPSQSRTRTWNLLECEERDPAQMPAIDESGNYCVLLYHLLMPNVPWRLRSKVGSSYTVGSEDTAGMMRKIVQSTSVRAVGYDADSQTLEIEFQQGEIYQYFGVSEFLFKGLMLAASKGTFFNRNIEGRFKYREVKE
jgi:hypothetical protein